MAAYFAPYLQDTHERLIHRRMITMAVQGLARDEDGEPATVEDVIDRTARIAKRSQVFHEDASHLERRRAAALWVTRELVAYDDRQSLEGVGLLRVELRRHPAWSAPARLTELGLGDQESWDLLHELLRNLRAQGAITMPEDVDHDDEAFAPRRGPIYLRGIGSEPKKKVLSWVPTAGTNGRADYLARVLHASGRAADATALLHGLWEDLDGDRGGDGPQAWFRSVTLARLGTVRRLDTRKLRMRPVGESEELFRCDRCRRLVPVCVLGVCPTLRCAGRLRPWRRPSAAAERVRPGCSTDPRWRPSRATPGMYPRLLAPNSHPKII